MAISYTMHVEGNLLKVTASGKDDNIEEVKQYGMAIIEKAITHGTTHVLCNETNLEYALSTFSIFESANFIAEVAPKVGRVAIVTHTKNEEDGQFWENVAVNRGLQVRVMTDRNLAEAWLNESRPES